MSQQRAQTPAPGAGDLLRAYRPGDVFLSSPEGVLHGTGSLAVLNSLDAVPAALASAGKDAVAVGAVPFDASRPAHLIVPESVSTAPPARDGGTGPRWRPLRGEWTLTPVPAPEEHTAAVERTLKLMADDDELRKVVLARCLRLESTEDVDVAAVLSNLLRRDPGAHVFATPLPERGTGPRTLIGASPELLVSRRGDAVVSNPLAGSARRSADPTKDQRAAVGLLTSDKDRREHAVVVEAVADALTPYCRELSVPDGPELLRTATMWHLSTRVTGRLRDADTPAHVLAAALHPTPAVCGTPTGRAFDTIAGIEPFDRGFYTGTVGYTDARGDGVWVVTIRCADTSGRTLDLFAGGGIMPESDPAAELAETSAKLRTLLLALGVDQGA
ncbi:isochorismate synthase [Nocardiopsis algeriensis]|uniref:isochorismate synthase n=1 Tax=Nocardiopsis algeriensis TaxID=1478215 RepID=A0A841J186_9ACTN|nr:isochorismate synthase [Nocardiopsis algeriensis]MBB6122101.1 isochorismate synthase [Nocardiopsis algeriensis]